MFPFSRDPKDPQPTAPAPTPQAPEAHPLDALTGGVFSAATSGERAQRVRDWLATGPAAEQMQAVYKELSAKDKGAAKALREKLDELRRAKDQEAVAAEWQAKAQALLDAARLNIADALAWQRDAAKAGAPLSREPLAGLRVQLVERIKTVEDLQQRVMVQREAAALLAQRIELLSTKPWAEAQAQQAPLAADLAHWREQAQALQADAQWPSVDLRYPPQIEAAQAQLEAVWSAFTPALAQAVAAALDAAAPLPPVPVWAEELRAARGEPAGEGAAAPAADKPARPRIDPEQRAAAAKAVEAGVMLLEQAVAAGHTKNTHSATQALRQSLKAHGRLIDDALEARVHATLVSAGELEGWQRWSADKLREQLVARAEALLVQRKAKGAPVPQGAPADAPEAAEPEAAVDDAAVAEAPVSDTSDTPEIIAESVELALAEGQKETETTFNVAPVLAPAPTPEAGVETIPAMGGRKLQESLRKLREEWKAADQGGAPNHALWKRFDRACNAAHKFVDAWLDKVRADAAEHRAQRLALIEDVKAWGAAHAQPEGGADWKAFNRQIHQFSEHWRNAGHLSEKAYADLQPQWKAAIHAAAAPLEAEQKASTARRQALIAEADALGAAPMLRIDAVRQLQQRWQAEAQTVPLDRKHEQKLWDAFRKPIDDAFNRKSAEREKQQAAMSVHDKAVLDAAKALEAANASGDAQRIRAAMAQLDAATRGQAAAASGSEEKQAPASADTAPSAPESGASEAAQAAEGDAGEGDGAAPAPAPAAPSKPAKPLIAMRGDDRPGARKSEPAPARGGKFGDRAGGRPGGPGGRDGRPGGFGGRDARGGGDRFGDRNDRFPREDRGPRLGDAAFRAQRDAVEHAEAALRKLAAQAHGEALTQLLTAWQQRQPDQVPSVQELGRAVTPAVRGAWTQALGASAGGNAGKSAEALLRLEMAAEVPTPADHLDARRALQLQLLTRRNDPAPAQTWGQDAAAVLAAGYDETGARRLQNALKALLRKG
ncbi:DUF349 domain-containing protein [Ottowia sp.]|jgi:predicted secreted protein|uniref:DUF349 domain-containing protein n=1 Tax=Ottowia sp. TaxID=1898956 RepID=UPI0025FB7A3A|nr:DUF349 domain-containing protein [Ottowia sp.]MBK6615963.1 DUF349 domain-containing protein [Ottowia sp.]